VEINHEIHSSVKVVIKSTISLELAKVLRCRIVRRAASISEIQVRFWDTHPIRSSIGWAKISGSSMKPRATSMDGKREGNNLDDTINATVNSASSATRVTRDGKESSRLFPTEGGLFRAFGHNPVVRVR